MFDVPLDVLATLLILIMTIGIVLFWITRDKKD
jgi:hypothetical protein